jgi:phenylalanyl-tRNA synthetase beta chain
VSPTTSPRDILTRLGFEVSGSGETVKVAVPSWRPDVEGKADLVEEVMRIHGVDEIDPQPLEPSGSVNGRILTRSRSAPVPPSARSPCAA